MKLEKGVFVSCKIHKIPVKAFVGDGYEDFFVLYFNLTKKKIEEMRYVLDSNKLDIGNGFEYQYVTNLRKDDHLEDYKGFVEDIIIIGSNKNLLRIE